MNSVLLVKNLTNYSTFYGFLLLIIFSFFPTTVILAQEKGDLYIVTEDYPPYEMKAAVKGQRGFDYDVVHLIFERMGYTPQIEFLPWKRALYSAEMGTTVGILTCAFLQERTKFILYSDPISEFTNGFFVRSGFSGPQPKKIEDVKGQKAASIASYESLKRLYDLGVKPFSAPNVESALKMLDGGRFDYLLLNKQATEYQIRNLEMTGKFIFYPTKEKEFHFCFSKKYPGVEAIARKFSTELAKLKADGTYDEIHGRYK